MIELAGAEKKEIQDEGINERQLEVENDSPTALDVKSVSVFDQIIGADDDPFLAVSLELHLNGEASACVTTNPSITSLSQALRKEVAKSEQFDSIDRNRDKYDFDLLLTSAIVNHLIEDKAHQCAPSDFYDESGQIAYDNPGTAFLSFCDMGDDRTPRLFDHDQLLLMQDPLSGRDEFACHFHTREGVRINSLEQFAQLAREAKQKTMNCSIDASNGDSVCIDSSGKLEIYAVQAGRVFMFAPKFVGEVFDLKHVIAPSGKPVSLEVLSLSPKVFDVKNFYADYEADAIVNKALTETSESHKMKRSSTGASGYNLNSRRTSENAFDTHSKMAMIVKKRCFEVLGFDQYVESMADGLQVLRYNLTTAYIPHLDWIDDDHRQQEHNFDSAGIGTNRFSTIFLYMSDLPEGAGGETVFTETWPAHVAEKDRMSLQDALEHIRANTKVNEVLKKGSWEEKMVAQCRTRLAIKPAHAKAILFYSQHPDGRPDQASLHGGCPVLDGTKWGANLWVWNGPRGGYPDAPFNEDVVARNRKNNVKEEESPYKQLHATFTNSGENLEFKDAELYFQETFWGKLGHNDPALAVNTYEGHEWNVMVKGEKKKTWIISKEEQQFYTL